MKKLILGVMTTLSATAWLLTYRTSTAGPLPTGMQSMSGSTSRAVSHGGLVRVDPAKGPVTKVTGAAVATRWGPVQVQLEVQHRDIVGVTLLQQPHDNAMDVFLANRSIPTLIKETLSAQSAHIDMATGATFTSKGYIASLQSALDQVQQ